MYTPIVVYGKCLLLRFRIRFKKCVFAVSGGEQLVCEGGWRQRIGSIRGVERQNLVLGYFTSSLPLLLVPLESRSLTERGSESSDEYSFFFFFFFFFTLLNLRNAALCNCSLESLTMHLQHLQEIYHEKANQKFLAGLNQQDYTVAEVKLIVCDVCTFYLYC